MKIVPCEQGSTAWIEARLGLPTASRFDSIVTPSGKLSESSHRYLCELVAERLLGMPVAGGDSAWMIRGSTMEAEAVAYYELQRGLDTQKVGFVTTDDRRIGCSPDRLVGSDGLLEIKVPNAATHVSYLLGEGAGKAYRPQAQGQLWVCEQEWVDVLSYNPELQPALMRMYRDEEFVELLSEAVTEFADRVDEATEKLKARAAA